MLCGTLPVARVRQLFKRDKRTDFLCPLLLNATSSGRPSAGQVFQFTIQNAPTSSTGHQRKEAVIPSRRVFD